MAYVVNHWRGCTAPGCNKPAKTEVFTGEPESPETRSLGMYCASCADRVRTRQERHERILRMALAELEDDRE